MSDPRIPQTPEEWAAWAASVQSDISQAEEGGREAVLIRMGYRSYENYLTRKLWKTIKERVMKRDSGRCFRCAGLAKHVHHDSYEEAVLRGEDDSKLFPLCEGCHHVVEFNDDGTRRSVGEKQRVLRTPDTRVGYPRPKIDLRRDYVFPLYPPEWERMNAQQRLGWRNEYEWGWLTRKFPEWETSQPEQYAEVKASYEATKANAQGEAKPPRKRKLPLG